MTQKHNVKSDDYLITSPNDWIRKAGGHVKDGKMIMPHKFIIIPMAMASEAVEEYHKNSAWNSRLKCVFVITLSIRIVDTSVFRMLAKNLNEHWKGGIQICSDCIRNGVIDTNLTKLRKEINEKIIHKMENAFVIDSKDFHLALDYYDEIFKLPLMFPIHIKEKQGVPLCKRCLKKNKKIMKTK